MQINTQPVGLVEVHGFGLVVITPDSPQPADQRLMSVTWSQHSPDAKLYSNCHEDSVTNLVGLNAIEFAGKALLEIARQIRERQAFVDAMIITDQR